MAAVHAGTASCKDDFVGSRFDGQPRFAGIYRECEDAVLHRLDLASLIREKAAYAARTVIEVDVRYSSQTCASCGCVCKESREGSQFACVRCGHAADADVNAAQVILPRAESPPMRAPGTARGRQHDAACPRP